MKIAIFGSCVSRDTCEFVPNTRVTSYVARQSFTSLLSPRGGTRVDIGRIDSEFQKRMVLGDLDGDGPARIIASSSDTDVILLDLADERRGFWLFPDKTTMTNSLEIEACGAAEAARMQGARVVPFGTDEHYNTWKRGFDLLVDKLEKAGQWEKVVFLDIEWASTLDGAQPSKLSSIGALGRRARRLKRAWLSAKRSIRRHDSIDVVLSRLQNIPPTQAEVYAERTSVANSKYQRYRRAVSAKVPTVIHRRCEDLRIGIAHRWGPEPFHYRDADYRSVASEICDVVGRQ